MINCKKEFSYEFNQNVYTSYHELGLAFSNDFDGCVHEVSQKGFLNKFKDDRLMCGQIDLILRRCKYTTSVATSVIYLLRDDKKIVIGENTFDSLMDICLHMGDIYPNVDSLIKIFFLDRCASSLLIPKTLNTKDKELVKYYNTIIKLEKHFDLEFSYYYMIHIHLVKSERSDFFGFTDLDYYIRSILSEPSKGVSASYMLANDYEFLARLCDFVGFDAVRDYLNCVSSHDYYYGLVNLIKEHSKFDLRPFLLKGYHVWLLDNFENYNYISKEAKELHAKLKRLPSMSQFKMLSEDDLIEVGSILKILYYDFVNLFTRNLLFTPNTVHITCKDLSYYMFIALDDVFVCDNYYSTVYDEDIEGNNMVVSCIIDEKVRISKEIAPCMITYEEKINEMDQTINLLDEKKEYYKKRIKTNWLLTILSFIILGSFYLRFSNESLKIDDIFDSVYLAGSFVSIVVSLILLIHYKIIKSKVNRKQKIYLSFNNSLVYLSNTKEVVISYKFDESEETVVQLLNFKKSQRPLDSLIGKYESHLYKENATSNFNYYQNEAVGGYEILDENKKDKHFVSTFINSIIVLLGINLLLFYLVQYFPEVLKSAPSSITDITEDIILQLSNWYYYALIVPLTVFVIGIIRKKNGVIQTLLSILLGTLLVFAFMYIIGVLL